MFHRLILIFTMIFCISNHVQAANEPQAFQSFEEFVDALESMPKAKFAKKGSVTSSSKISNWHQILTTADPIHFKKWNKKLVGLPTIGFKNNEKLWLLKNPYPIQEVGFIQHTPQKPFSNFDDFINSLQNEELDVFQSRARVSSSQDLKNWLGLIAKEDQKSYVTVLSRLKVMRKIGYLHEDEFQFPNQMVRAKGSPRMMVGFGNAEMVVAPHKKIEVLADLITSFESETPNVFASQFVVLQTSKKTELMRELKKSQPELYEQVVARLRSRNVMGFGTCNLNTILNMIKP